MTNLLDIVTHWLEPMRRPEPTRRCPTLADGIVQDSEKNLRTEPETVRVDLATFHRIRLEMHADAF